MNGTCSYCGSVINSADDKCKNCGATNDAYAPVVGGAKGASTGPWPFESSVSGFGDRLVGSMGLSRTGSHPGLLEMMIRGAFLDGSVYRMAAADTNGNANALIAILIPAVAGMLGSWLLTYHFAFFGHGIFTLLTAAVIGVIALLASIGIMAALSQAVLRSKLTFGQLFRALAYAQSPGVLTIIPVLGSLLGLWRIMTSLVAVREISGSDVAKSAVLLVIGLVSSIVIGLILSPLLLSTLALRPW